MHPATQPMKGPKVWDRFGRVTMAGLLQWDKSERERIMRPEAWGRFGGVEMTSLLQWDKSGRERIMRPEAWEIG